MYWVSLSKCSNVIDGVCREVWSCENGGVSVVCGAVLDDVDYGRKAAQSTVLSACGEIQWFVMRIVNRIQCLSW